MRDNIDNFDNSFNNFEQLGTTGLNVYGERIYEEVEKRLKGTAGIKVFREMLDNDAIVSSVIFSITMMLRRVSWLVEPASKTKKDKYYAQFITECMHDMEITWEELITEICTFLSQGFSFHEICYKKRNGYNAASESMSSKYDDGKIGWKKIESRDQLSILQGGWKFSDDGELLAAHQVTYMGKNVDTYIPMRKGLLFRTTSLKNNPEGRAMPLDVPLLTTDGWKTHGTVNEGDYVYDEHGKPTKVVAKSIVWKDRPCYEIKFRDGSSIKADKEHLWAIINLSSLYRGQSRTIVNTDWLFLKDHMYNEIMIPRETLHLQMGETLRVWRAECFIITEVNQIDSQDTVCIEVENESHLYLAGANLIPTHNSILRSAYRAYFFKRNLENIEGISAERDGAGLPVIEAPAELFHPKASEASKAMLRELKNIARNIRIDEQMGLVMPKEYNEQGKEKYGIRLLSSGGTKSNDISKMIQRYASEIAMSALADFVLLGHTERGTQALAREKSDLFLTAIRSWLDVIVDQMNKAIQRLIMLNGWDIKSSPRLTYGDISDRNVTQFVNNLRNLSASGMRLFPDLDLENLVRARMDVPILTEEQYNERLIADQAEKVKVGDNTNNVSTELVGNPNSPPSKKRGRPAKAIDTYSNVSDS